MSKVKIGDTIVEYPDAPSNEGWEDVPPNNTPWEDVPKVEEKPGLIKRGWDFLNTPVTTYLPENARNLIRKGLGYNPLFDTALDYAGVSPNVTKGLETAKENLGEGLLTPLSIGTMGASGLIAKAPLLARTLAGGFALASGKGAIDSAREAYNAQDTEERTKAVAEGAGNLAFTGLGALGAMHNPAKGSVTADIKNAGPRLLENAKGSEGEMPPFQGPIITPWENTEIPTVNRLYPPGEVLKRPTQGDTPIIDVDTKVSPVKDVKLSPEDNASPINPSELYRPFTKPEDTSTLNKLPIRYQEQFPQQSMFGVRGNLLEKGSENVNQNEGGLASKVGNKTEELEQTQLNKNTSGKTPETSGVVQESPPVIKDNNITGLQTAHPEVDNLSHEERANLVKDKNTPAPLRSAAEKSLIGDTLYSGIPFHDIAKAIAHTTSDIWNSKVLKESRELAASKFRDSINTIGKVGGEAGKYIAPKLEGFFRSEREYYGQIVNDALGKMKASKLTGKEQDNLVKAAWEMRYGKPSTVKLNAKQTALLSELRANLKSVHDEQRKLGILVGGFRSAMDNPLYWPGIISTKVIDTITGKPESMDAISLKNDWVKHVIEQSKGKVGLDEAKKAYNDYVNAISKFGKSSTDFAAIRKAEGYGVPWSWQEKSLPRVFSRYGRRVSRDFAYFKNIESDPTARGILQIADQYGKFDKNATKLPGGVDITPISSMPQVKELEKWINQDFTKSDVTLEAVGRVVKTGMLGVLTSGSNYIQNIPKVAPYLSPSQWGLYAKAHFMLRDGLKDALKQGVARINPAEIANPDIASPLRGANSWADTLNQAANAAYRWQGGSYVENTTRALDMALGQMLVTSHLGKALAKGDKNSISVLDNLAKHAGVEDWRLMKGKTPPKEWVDKMAATFVERVQQTYDPRDQPMYALNSKLSPFLSLSRWAIGASNHIYRDVVEPMAKGNFTPALSYLTMSGIVGATALPALHSLLTNRDPHDPTIKEAILSGNKKEMAIAFANAFNLASFGGIVGDLFKSGIELSQGRKPRGFSFPVIDFLTTQLVERTRQAAEAIKNGEPADEVMLHYITQGIQDNVQSLRIVANHTWNAQNVEQSNKVRNYETFRRLNNEPQMETPSGNPFISGAEKEFKRSTNPQEAGNLGMKAINKIIANNQEDPMRLISKLHGLKSMPITWAPSLKQNPMEFMNYLNFVEKSQGKEAAQKLMNDYAMQRSMNEAKSKMVPNIRVR